MGGKLDFGVGHNRFNSRKRKQKGISDDGHDDHDDIMFLLFIVIHRDSDYINLQPCEFESSYQQWRISYRARQPERG